ncbi:MAG: cytochrome c [Rhodanobacteraceae bacterium]|nr:MAG: cytochrome c [Rhodanobacteraceae bacterium]
MQQRIILVSLAAAALALGFGTASAKGNAAAGAKKAVACEACHGKDGNGTAPNYPALAGQYQDYLIEALHEYQTNGRTHPLVSGIHHRDNAIMNAMAAPLTEQDIEDITAYFSSLPSKLSDLSGKVQGSDDGLHSRG